MSIQSKFNTFNQRIQLTRQDDAYKESREKDDSKRWIRKFEQLL